MRRILWMAVLLAGLSACAAPAGRNTTADAIRHEMNSAAQESASSSKSEEVDNALLPPLSVQMPKVDNKPLETRFDLTVNHTPAGQVFMAIVSGTRYSMLVPPDITGDISLSLKDVTVFDALEAIHNLYGYDYKVDGTRIYIQPVSMQTRLFQVNYLNEVRNGTSSLRVTSGSIADAPNNNQNPGSSTNTLNQTVQTGMNSSKVETKSNADFWPELEKAVKLIVGVDQATSKDDKGRSVVISPMSGVIVVRAMPAELNSVAAYLKASQLSIDRQVILEAKIIEVQLNDSFQSGVNWAGFGNLRSSPTSRGSFGVLSPGGSLLPDAAGGASQAISNNLLSSTPGASLAAAASSASGITGSLFGLSFQTDNFAALLNFLESQGTVHVLSSPRIATLNNQKAVLKVGTDDFFVTNITNTITTGTSTTTTPTVTLAPFFSGIALDVTPRIDENSEIILHVHPSVSQVTTVTKTVDTGTGGTLILPLASSSVSETDSIVRARDGQIVAIGGLMRQSTTDDQSGLPGMSKRLFGQTSKQTEKRELIILIKPTVVNSDKDWSSDISQTRERVNSMLDSAGSKP
jgi:MSHA biogenesis protein MshL